MADPLRPSSSRSDALSALTATGPVGEPGLPPARPASESTNRDSRTSTQRSFRPMSRRDENSRPSSGMSGPSHVPSLAIQSAFRPMSPQKLQAQRGQNIAPPSSTQGGHRLQHSVDESSEDKAARRLSLASINTAREIASRDRDVPPLPSSGRGFPISASTEPLFSPAAAPESVVSDQSQTPLNPGEKPPLSAAQPAGPPAYRNSNGWVSSKSHRERNAQQQLSQDNEKLSSPAKSPIKSNTKSTHLGRNYQFYAGNYLFFCLGRCLNTKAKPLNVVTGILTLLPAILFFIFSAPWLSENVSPALPIVFAYVFFVAFSAFLHAAFSDPGVLPRNLHPHPPNPDEERDPLTVGPPTTEWVMVKTFPSKQMKVKLEEYAAEDGAAGPNSAMTAMEVPTKYCKTCNVWRPPRAHHCRVCDACIETQDHHCVWLNNCVGRRNYRFFFAYIGFGSIMAVLLIAFSLTHVGAYASQNDMSFGDALSGRAEERVAFAMFIYALLALPYPGSLFGYHLFLIARGETTREYLNSHKFLPKDRHRPFSQSSMLRNWLAVLMRPRPPSYLAFKKAYQHGDIRLGHTMPRKDRVEKEKLDAVRSQSRVNGLKQRFSVPKGNFGGRSDLHAQASGNAERDVEMKNLHAPPKTADSGIGGAQCVKSQQQKSKNLPGGANSTPR
ncbi:hypothetical protein CERZMDRAFT_87956 [Cercospora zeae-maydis SCOH1-5]|uniref:Palmitoyltransferase n=1 Tax=Cercospora zeae-maydis SCOH1-5 TaxID=717836 RepID=A0A6A6F3C4_9PEZI|nr:hypothetical protein CERZMDRAFT_87956 [Cercospora zeae-maydis SCOH1-5]